MIDHPFSLILILLVIECIVLFLASHPRTKHLFNFIPSMFWIYFVPMLLSTVGLIDPKSPLYAAMAKYLLPIALFLLLLQVDIKAILRLGPMALLMFFSGSLGIMLGMVVSFMLFKSWIGSEFWSGFGALAGSWTGGSANMIAVKEALGTPEAIFTPMVIVDTIVPYLWMGMLVALVGVQKIFDQWNRSKRQVIEDLEVSIKEQKIASATRIIPGKAVFILLLAGGIGWAVQIVAGYLPSIKDVITGYAWTIILVSTLALFLSTSPLGRLQGTGANTFGYWLLYFVLTTIGARASLTNLPQAGILIATGLVVVIIHALVLLITARLTRAPLFLVASASQANVGGVASAPVVAEVYQPGLACVGLLLAILGNIIGTYAGILTGQFCRFFSY